MPGILPMKVIKVGTSSQSRIAQACDRCRSKKIRCDGVRPTCSQCANVGFECKTSDKLSRRAFPRGYTESLEERVRQLETEVRELKDLLDEKDEKIDLLSKMHGNHHHRPPIAHTPHSPVSDIHRESITPPPKEDTFRVQASPLLLGVENSDSYFMGPSSGRGFIESFKRKMQEKGKSCTDFYPEAFLHIQGCPPLVQQPSNNAVRLPPRLFSDRCVNVYFQEWAPLFPVLHKPTFLRIYEEFVADPEKVKNNHKVAQLYLVCAIAALSGETPDYEQIAFCEQKWQGAIEAILLENTMATLQCLVLAMIYCTVRADYKRLQHYKGVAIGLSHRLGLHQSQKRFSFGALTIETRKKVFWTLYTIDCFSGAILGLPKLMKEEDIHAEFPSDTDDEYVTEKGFQPTLPGEYTKLSSALALFRCSRILGKVLEKNYPAASAHELSLQQMSTLEVELDEWQESLPAHLKLNFVQDKPSTDVTGSRSPLLALAYYYTKTLIFRPAIGSTLGPKAAPALLSVGDASKHIIQIAQLLDERGMSFSFCTNKTDMLMLCGMALLYQSLSLKKDSKLSKDAEKLVNSVNKIATKAQAPGWVEFRRVAGTLVRLDDPSPVSAAMPSPGASRPKQHSPQVSKPALSSKKKSPVIGSLPAASVSDVELVRHRERERRMTVPSDESRTELYSYRYRNSFDGVSFGNPSHDNYRHSLSQTPSVPNLRASSGLRKDLDFLSLSSDPGEPTTNTSALHAKYQQHQTMQPAPQAVSYDYPGTQVRQKANSVSTSEWEVLLGALDGGVHNVYDAIYGGGAPLLKEETPSSTDLRDWSPDSWEISQFNVNDLNNSDLAATSALSVSEESLSSGEELSLPGEPHLGANDLYYNQALLACATNDGFILDPLDGRFGV